MPKFCSSLLDVGYKQGYIVQTRITQAYYDASNDDIATITEHYIYDGTQLQHYHHFAPSEALDTGPRYIAMLSLPAAIGTVYTDGPAYHLTNQADSTNWRMQRSCRTVKVSDVVSGAVVCMQVDSEAAPVEYMFSRRTKPPIAAEDNQKLYWDIGSTINSTDSWSGGWTFWVEAA